MEKFVIERNLPGAANFSRDELRDIAQAFCEAARRLEKPYTWLNNLSQSIRYIASTLLRAKRPFVNTPGLQNFQSTPSQR